MQRVQAHNAFMTFIHHTLKSSCTHAIPHMTDTDDMVRPVE